MTDHPNRSVFHSFKEATMFAKKHPGMTVTRLESGKGWQVFPPKNSKSLSPDSSHSQKKRISIPNTQEKNLVKVPKRIPKEIESTRIEGQKEIENEVKRTIFRSHREIILSGVDAANSPAEKSHKKNQGKNQNGAKSLQTKRTTRTCSCGGSNENCWRCSGKGFYRIGE